MIVTKTELEGVLIFELAAFEDTRGHFLEFFQAKRYREYGISEHFVQDNFSRSKKNTLRGLHYQLHHAQGKLVFVTQGAVLDVIVDIRQGSPTFGKHIAIELSDKNHKQIYIPAGYAHGFCVLSDHADFIYKCTDYYNPADERGIIWNDPDLAISWSVSEPLLSPKDASYACLKDIAADQFPVTR